ncbi:hypothetical protein [Haladaptatus sp. NG-WS-4]
MSDDSEKTLDETLSRHVARRFGTLSLVESVSVFPHERPDSIVMWFDRQYFPTDIRQVGLEICVRSSVAVNTFS